MVTNPVHIGANVARVFCVPNLHTYTWVSHVSAREQQKGWSPSFHLHDITSAQQNTHGRGILGQSAHFARIARNPARSGLDRSALTIRD
jgi:hypothetical protein